MRASLWILVAGCVPDAGPLSRGRDGWSGAVGDVPMRLSDAGVLDLRDGGAGWEVEGFGEARPTSRGGRVVFARDGLDEWYEARTDAAGRPALEQGFTVARDPEPGAPLAIRLALRGLVAAPAGGGARLTIPGGPSFRWSGLAAWDADGAALPVTAGVACPDLDGGCRLVLAVDDARAAYPVVVDPLLALEDLGEDGTGNNALSYAVADGGAAVAISGGHALVGGPGGGITGSGEVRFAERDFTGWVHDGAAVALSGGGGAAVAMDYPYAAAGRPGVDQVQLWEHDGTSWVAGSTLSGPAGSEFGAAVALQGELLAVGAPAGNRVRLFTTLESPPVQIDAVPGGAVNDLTSASGRFGSAVAVSGPLLVVGAPTAGTGGRVFAYEKGDVGTPTQLDGAAGEGLGAALAADGEFVAVGAPGADAVDVYRRTKTGNTWTLAREQRVGAPPDANATFGASVALSGLVLAAPSAGPTGAPVVHTFERSAGLGGAAWGWVTSAAEPAAADPAVVDLDVDDLVIGTPDLGRARFRRLAEEDLQTFRLDGDDVGALAAFGEAVAVDGRWAVVGAPDDGPLGDGRVYVFERDGVASWRLHTTLAPTDGAPGAFGAAVAISGLRLVVGDPEQAADQGGAFLYEWDGAAWTQVADLGARATPPADAGYGRSVAIADDVVVVGAPGAPAGVTVCSPTTSGGVYLHYRRNGSAVGGPDEWQDHAITLADATRLGFAVATDGRRVAAVRRCGTPEVRVYDLDVAGAVQLVQSAVLAETASVVAVAGELLALGLETDGTGGANAGKVVVYAGWLSPTLERTLQAPAPAAQERFGAGVALAGDRLVVGASGTDRLYVFERHRGGTGSWSSPDTVVGPPGTAYGSAVGADGLTLLVGMPAAAPGGVATGAVRFEERRANAGPHAVDDALAVAEDATTTLDVRANDEDPNQDPLTVSITSAPAHGAATVLGNGSVRYAPDADYVGADTFAYTVSDGALSSAPASVAVTVTGTPDPPTAGADAYPAAGDTLAEDASYTVPAADGLLANDTDPDLAYGDDLDVTVTRVPAHGTLSVTPATGAFTYTPDPDFAGADDFAYQACDDAGACSAEATVTLAVAPVNDAPVGAPDGPIAVVEDLAFASVASVLANDVDVDDAALEAVLEAPPGHAVGFDLAPDGTWTYTGAVDYAGPDVFSYRVRDPAGLRSAPIRVDLSVTAVNDTPLPAVDRFDAVEDVPLAVPAAAGLGANDRDVETPLAGLSFGFVSGDPGITVAGDGGFSWAPHPPDAHGPVTFDYRVCDPEGACGIARATVDVAPVNDPPRAAADAFAGREDEPIVGDLLANDADVDDAAFAAVVTDPPAGDLALAPDGTFTWTPPADANGASSFGYQACDDDPDPLLRCSAEVRVTLDLAPVNDAPRAAFLAAPPTDEEVEVVADVLLGAVDPEGDPITAALDAGPAHAERFELRPDGALAYLPERDFAGTDTVRYVLCDPEACSDPVEATLEVRPIDDRPEAAPDDRVAVQDLRNELASVLDNDADVDSAPLVAVLRRAPAHAAAFELRPDGTALYEPDPGYLGGDAFDYAASGDGVESTPVTVTIRVVRTNLPPVAADATWRTGEDVPLVSREPGLLADASDPDSDPLTAALVSPPAAGTATVHASGAWAFVPPPDFVGSTSFRWRACDLLGACAEAVATVEVEADNDAPDARDDAWGTDEDAVLVVPAPGVLANDGDAEGRPTARLALGPAHAATFSLGPDGALTYAPQPDHTGADTFTYVAVDADGTESRVATVTLTVAPRPDPPVAVDDGPYAARSGETLRVAARDGLLANDRDPDGDPLRIRVLTPFAGGAFTLDRDGGFRYEADAVGPDTLTYALEDGAWVSPPATVTVEVAAGEAPPDTGDSAAPECPDRWWPDRDGDGFGARGAVPVTACAPPTGWADNDGDCDDTRADRAPGGAEVAFDGIDQDCSGADFSPEPIGACDSGAAPAGALALAAAAALARRRQRHLG